ncbi:MAG: Fic/DOC family N-terminal domain-containing protein [Crocinitomicaceae bacterium]
MPEILYQINPNRNKPWNDLPELPIREELYETIEILKKLGDAKAALARLQGRSAVISNQGLLINSISLQEAKMSSAIENIFTTDDELYKEYSDQNPEATGASKEVLRYREALWSGYSFLAEAGSFSQDYFTKVFQEIKETTDKIRPPFTETRIKQGGTGPNAGQVIYTLPKGKNIIEKKLDNLIAFLNDDDQYQIDHLIKMAIAHFQFEAIHPFRDGNGRVGRVFNIHYLTFKGLLDFPILFLSRYILDNKDDYYSGLQEVSQRGSWKNWILFMLRAVEYTSNITYTKINEIVSAKEAISDHVKNEGKFLRSDDLVEFIFTQPFTKVNHLVDSEVYAEKTARKYLNDLCEMQVLEKKTIEGKHYYLNLELYRILSE